MNGLVSHQLTVKYLKATSRSEAYLSLIRKLLCKDKNKFRSWQAQEDNLKYTAYT